MIVGNDISRWQGDVNYDTYKNNTNFLIIKSSEGVGFTDPKFTRNQSEARRTNIPLGYYHFARPDLGNSAEAEADSFLKVTGTPVPGEVYILDYEPASNPGDVVVWCKRFLDRVFEKIRVKPLIYLNQSQAKSFNWLPVVAGGYALWIASYTYDPNKNIFETGSWPMAAMQQWTNKQTVPGITGGVDGNVFFGDIMAFKKYGYQPPVEPPVTPPVEPPKPPEPPPEPPVVIPPVTEPPIPNPVPDNSAELMLNQIRQIVWDKWCWIGTRGWKIRLASLRKLLPL